jgi:hypothetical protein
MPAIYGSAIDTAVAPHREAKAHGHDEKKTGHPVPDWYPQHVAGEPSGRRGGAYPGASA